MKVFTKESLKEELQAIRSRGWIETQRKGNDGGVGNTLEDLLGIEENNLPLPNAGEWEVKGQREDSNSLITLFHMEPSPRALKFVSQVLLPHYGWRHAKAGRKHPDGERSFRQTLTAGARTNRGFTIRVNRRDERLEVSFDHASVDREKHGAWAEAVERSVGLGELEPQPYWGFDDVFHKAGTKLNKTLYAIAERRESGESSTFGTASFSCWRRSSGTCSSMPWKEATCSWTSTQRRGTTTAPSSGCDRGRMSSCTAPSWMCKPTCRLSS